MLDDDLTLLFLPYALVGVLLNRLAVGVKVLDALINISAVQLACHFRGSRSSLRDRRTGETMTQWNTKRSKLSFEPVPRCTRAMRNLSVK